MFLVKSCKGFPAVSCWESLGQDSHGEPRIPLQGREHRPSLDQWLPTRVRFVPQRTSDNVWRQFLMVTSLTEVLLASKA